MGVYADCSRSVLRRNGRSLGKGSRLDGHLLDSTFHGGCQLICGRVFLRYLGSLLRASYSEDTVAAQDYFLQLPLARLLTVL